MTTERRRQLDIKRYTIAPELYQKGFPEGQGPCRCTSQCCQHGVYVDIRERDDILAHKDIIKQYMDETQSTDERTWFEMSEEDDVDFPSGKCTGTEVINGKCAFLDRLGRCSIQLASTEQGGHKWEMKPLFCILFPLTIAEGVVTFDDMLDQEQQCCTLVENFTTPMYEACKEELLYVFGREGYDAIASLDTTRSSRITAKVTV